MDLSIRKMWYARNDVMSNIMPLIRAREVCFLQPYSKDSNRSYPVRCIKAHHSSYLYNNMKAFDFEGRKYNLYHSIFHIKDMPMFSYNPLSRSTQQKEFFNNFEKYVYNVDYVVDFDGEGFSLQEKVDQAREACLKFSNYLTKSGIPHAVIFSGSKGFHLEIRNFKDMPDMQERLKVFQEFTDLVATQIGVGVKKNKDDVGVIDGTIYTSTRIWKCPYSYDVKTDMIVYPLDSYQLENFKLKDYEAVNLMREGSLWNRGLLERPGDIQNFFILYNQLKKGENPLWQAEETTLQQ